MKRIPPAEILAAHQAARKRLHVSRIAGQIYAHTLRVGCVDNPTAIGKACQIRNPKVIDRALVELRAANLIP